MTTNTKMHNEMNDTESNCPSCKDRENRTTNIPMIIEIENAVKKRASVEEKGKIGVSASMPCGSAIFHA